MFKQFLAASILILSGLTIAEGQTITPTTTPGVSINDQTTLKNHYEQGMKDFQLGQFEFALPELIASTAVLENYSWQTWYVNAYITMGVIYEFHSKDPKNRAYAYMYYSLALARDPKNVTANLYIKDVDSAKDDAKSLFPTPVSTPLSDGTKKTDPNTWIPAPLPKDTGRMAEYSISNYYKWDASGSSLATLGDVFVHKKIDQYLTTGDLWVRVNKSYSSSDNLGSVNLWEGKITFLEPWMQLSVGRMDLFSTVTPGSFFGNYPMMGIHRVDGVLFVLPLFVKIGVDQLDSFQAPPLAFSLFYTPSLLSAQNVQLDSNQSFLLSQLRFRINLFGMQTTFRTNMGWTSTDYFNYSSLNGGFTFSESADAVLDDNMSVYGEVADQNPNYFSQTDVVMGGFRMAKLGTWGPFSLDELCIEGQFPLGNSSNNLFTGGNEFFPNLAQNSTTTLYGGAKFRLQDITFNLGVSNNLDDYTLNRVTTINSPLSTQLPIGPGRETITGVSLLSPSAGTFAFIFGAGISF
jgi:hypothetical protein